MYSCEKKYYKMDERIYCFCDVEKCLLVVHAYTDVAEKYSVINNVNTFIQIPEPADMQSVEEQNDLLED